MFFVSLDISIQNKSFEFDSFGNTKPPYLFQSFEKQFLMGIADRQPDRWDSLRTNQFARNRQKVAANRLKRTAVVRFGKTKAFEPVQEIVSEADQMKISDIGFPDSRRDFAQAVGLFEFPNYEFRFGPVVVEAPDPVRGQSEIGDDRLISESLHLKKRKLPARFFGYGTPNDDKTFCRFPALGLVAEFGSEDLARNSMEAKTAEPGFHRLGEFRHDRVGSPSFLEKFDDLVIEECVVGADANLLDRRRDLQESALQKFEGHACRVDVARMKAAFPNISCDPFETKQWMVRRPSSFLRVVSHLGPLLSAVNGQYRRIQIEENLAGRTNHSSDQPVVKSDKRFQPLVSKPDEKPSQSRRIGIAFESCQVAEDAIAFEDACCVDSSQTDKDGIQKGQDRFACRVAIVALFETDIPSQKFSEFDFLEEILNEKESTEMSQILAGERKTQIFGSVGHCNKTPLKVLFCGKVENVR